MEKEREEIPIQYIITGHPGVGKSSRVAELLPDHPFVPDVYQYNTGLNYAAECYQEDKDINQYVKRIDKAMQNLDDYCEKQLLSKSNLYIEADASFELPHLITRYQNKTESITIFLLCDNLKQSLTRMQSKQLPFFPDLDNKEIAAKYHSTNKQLNEMVPQLKGTVQVYDGSGQRPLLLAIIKNGGVERAAASIEKKEWLHKNSRLHKSIQHYFSICAQRDIAHKTSESPTIPQLSEQHPQRIRSARIKK